MNDTEQHLWKMPELNPIDSTAWLALDEAAALLGLGPRQVARRAQEGMIEKRTLPKAKGEKAARVVYSRADIEAIKAGNPNHGQVAKTNGASLTAAALGLSPADLAEALKAEKVRVIEATADLASTVEASTAVIRSLITAVEARTQAVQDSRAPDIRDFPSGEALMSIAESLSKIVAAHTQAALPPPAPEPMLPWLTLDEAVKVSGLTRAWLLKEAEAGEGDIAIRDMGRGARGGRWRFFRNDLRTT